MFPPREGDLPREELLKAAQEQTGPHGQWPGGEVLFKFSCSHCGERCTFQEPNQLFENGECHVCGKSTKVEYGGFAIHFIINAPNTGKDKDEQG